MIKVVIIDDEEGSIELASNLLKLGDTPAEVIATAHSVESGLRVLQNHKPDLLLLDVEMKDGTGFDLLRRLGNTDFRIIFITAHQEFAIDAFRFSALDYLLKPLSPLDFANAIKKAGELIGKEEQQLTLQTLLYNITDQSRDKRKVVLKTIDRVYVVTTGDIIRFESDGSYTSIYLKDGKRIVVSRLIKEFDEMLASSGFIRTHQSHLINAGHVFCFSKPDNHVVMKDESVVPVSARRKDLIMTLIQDQ